MVFRTSSVVEGAALLEVEAIGEKIGLNTPAARRGRF
jgi:hypothetical protein